LPVVFRLMARVAHVMERSEPTQGRATPCRGAATDDRERCRLARALSWDGRSGRICRWTARTAQWRTVDVVCCRRTAAPRARL